MRARWRGAITEKLPAHEAQFVTPGQAFLSPGKEYEVHAVSVYDGIAFLQVIDDLNTPVFNPRALFEVVDPSIPYDWICNTFPEGPVQLVLGPSYVAGSLDAYGAMIDQREPAFAAFWNRVELTTRPPRGNGSSKQRPTWGDTVWFKGELLQAVHSRRVGAVCGIREVDTDDQAAQLGCAKGTLLVRVALTDGVIVEVPEALVEVLES